MATIRKYGVHLRASAAAALDNVMREPVAAAERQAAERMTYLLLGRPLPPHLLTTRLCRAQRDAADAALFDFTETVEVPAAVLDALLDVYRSDREGLGPSDAYRVVKRWEGHLTT